MRKDPLPLARTVADRERGTRRGDLAASAGLPVEALEHACADLALLAHPVRLRILDILARQGGEVCVCDLEGALPVKQPTVSHHLRILREAGLIDTVRRGVWAYYFIRPDVLASLRRRVSRVLGALG
jgi:ArsR family transcriptional regulator